MSFSTTKPLNEISAGEIKDYISVLTNELVRRLDEEPPPPKKTKKHEPVASSSANPNNGKVGMFPCADKNCPKHDLIFTETVIYNRDSEEEDLHLHKRFSCCTKTCIVYGILCLHPNCMKKNKGRPLLVYVGQTEGGVGDRVFGHMIGVDKEVMQRNKKEPIHIHFHEHWAEISEKDKKGTSATKLWFRFVVFDQFLRTERKEIDGNDKERELIKQFDLQSKHGCNERSGGKGKTPQSTASTSSKLPIRAHSTTGGSPKAIELPFHSKYLIALALKNSEDGSEQMKSIDIFNYIETNFGKLFTSYGIMRKTMSDYLMKNTNTSRSEVPQQHRTDWFRRFSDNPSVLRYNYAFIQGENLMSKINEDLLAFLRDTNNQNKLRLLMDNPSSLPDHLNFV